VVHPAVTTLLHVPLGGPTQVSVVPATPSSQFAFEAQQLAVGAYQLEHAPLTQASPVHPLPSLQVFELSFGCVQLPAEQTSSVQGFPSLAHVAVLFVWTQPVTGWHESVVHTLESSQLSAVPTQTPLEQASPVVQAVPSEHVVPLARLTCPHTPAAQLSVVQEFPSSQLSGVPPHVPLVHTSPVVQRLPSLQVVPLTTLTKPHVPAVQLSVVHALPSSQTIGVPAQTPDAQLSPVVQALPSEQEAPSASGAWAQVPPLQLSAVQELPSSQLIAVPPHVPVVQTSPVVHASPSVQVVPLARFV
jgi:hypothetical protein